MGTTFISTRYLNDSARGTIMQLQNRLAVAQKEVTTGRLADEGVTLGARTTSTVSIRQAQSRMQAIIDTSATVSARLDVTQSSITNFTTMAQSFISTLITAKSTATGAVNAENAAKANLSALTGGLNASVAGENIFSGIKTDVMPITNYYATPTPGNKAALDAAFFGEFGTTQSDPGNTSITVSQMQAFLNGSFADLFDPANAVNGWLTNWSAASSENMKTRISATTEIETSSNANYVAYRKLAQAFAMVGEVGVQNLTQNTFGAVADAAIQLAGDAVRELGVEAGRLGAAQEQITSSNNQMTAQISLYNTQLTRMEAVDPFDAAARVTTLETQLQTAYALTSRIQSLTLLNYLPV